MKEGRKWKGHRRNRRRENKELRKEGHRGEQGRKAGDTRGHKGGWKGHKRKSRRENKELRKEGERERERWEVTDKERCRGKGGMTEEGKKSKKSRAREIGGRS